MGTAIPSRQWRQWGDGFATGKDHIIPDGGKKPVSVRTIPGAPNAAAIAVAANGVYTAGGISGSKSGVLVLCDKAGKELANLVLPDCPIRDGIAIAGVCYVSLENGSVVALR